MMKKQVPMPARAAALLASALLAAGCAGPASFDMAEADRTVLGDRWNAAAPALKEADTSAMENWWKAWNDPVLDELIDAALAANTDIRTALASLRAAAALSDEATAALFPTLGVSAGGQRQRSEGRRTTSWNAAGELDWTWSLAGGNLAARRAARYEALSQAMTVDDTRIAVAAEVAQAYINLRLALVSKSIGLDMLDNYTQISEVARWRFEAGMVGQTDYDQAVSNREQARAEIPALDYSADQYRNALARLTGKNVADLPKITEARVPQAPDALALSIPAEMLRRRPDMRKAEYDIIAAAERVSEAKAKWYPALSITGSLGTQAAKIGALGASGSGVASLLGAISMPVFNWSEQVSATEQAKAALESAEAAYTATLLSALEETENALSGISSAQKREPPLKAAEAAADSAAKLAFQQYGAGLEDLDTVLSTQNTYLSVRKSRQENAADLANRMIDLYRAMGGGWTPPEAAAPGGEAAK